MNNISNTKKKVKDIPKEKIDQKNRVTAATTKSVAITSISPSSTSKKEGGATSPTNGNGSSVSQAQSLPEIIPTSFTASGNKIMYDRTLWIVMNLVGKFVEVQVKTGEYYEGILHTATTDKGLGVVLKMARKKDSEKKIASRPMGAFVIYPADLVQVYAKDVDFNIKQERDFATDTDISGQRSIKERELQPWMPDNVPIDPSLELDDAKEDWDQFEVNKQLYGVDTTYSEEFYTTKLDKSSHLYKEKYYEASRIASEIEGKPTHATNIHILEERGVKIEAEYDEEEKYSSVIRDSGGKYIPPQKRAQVRSDEKDTKNVKRDHAPRSTEKRDNLRDRGEEIAANEHILERTDSMEELGELGSKNSSTRGSPRSPRSPLSPGKDRDYALAAERLRVRLYMVGEKYKNSAPVVQKEDKDVPAVNPTRSPLISPLIGDARSVNALSLEPSTPNIPAEVVKDFFDFSLAKKESRDKTIAEMKKFSKNLEKKLPPPKITEHTASASVVSPTTQPSPQKTDKQEVKMSTTDSPSKPTTATPSPEVTESSSKSVDTKPKTELPTKQEVKLKTESPKQDEPSETKAEIKAITTSAPSDIKPKAAPQAKSDTTSTEASKDTTAAGTGKSTLNPHAKEYKPMSARAPSFTPSAMVSPVAYGVPQPMLSPQEMSPESDAPWAVYNRYREEEAPYFPPYQIPGRAPMYSVPFVAGPQPIMHPQFPPPVRIGLVPQTPPFPYPPGTVYPQTASPQGTPQPRVNPPKLPTGTNPPPQVASSPTYPNPAFLRPVVYPGPYFPSRGMPPPMFFDANERQNQTFTETPKEDKFAVPNADKLT